MDAGPEFETVLKPSGGQDLAHKLWSEFVFGTAPKGGKAKLCVGVKSGFSEDAFLGMKKLSNEGVVESGLPFLDEGQFETAVVSPVGVYWDGSPNIQVVMVLPVV